MRTFRIDRGTLCIQAGEVVRLTQPQLDLRREYVETVGADDEGVFCRVKVAIEFKAGEIVGLNGSPDGRITPPEAAIFTEGYWDNVERGHRVAGLLPGFL